MMSMRASPLSMFGLLALTALNGFALFLLILAAGMDDTVDIKPQIWRPTLSGKASISPDAQQGRKTHEHTLVRPIFLKNRRPYQSPPPVIAKPAPKPVKAAPPPPITDPGLMLAGIAIRSEARQAFMTHPSNAEGSWVKEGEDIMGWRVSAILPGEVTIQRSGRSIKLRLYK